MASHEVTRRQFIRRAGGTAGAAAVGLQLAQTGDALGQMDSGGSVPPKGEATPAGVGLSTTLPPIIFLAAHDHSCSSDSLLWQQFTLGMAQGGVTVDKNPGGNTLVVNDNAFTSKKWSTALSKIDTDPNVKVVISGDSVANSAVNLPTGAVIVSKPFVVSICGDPDAEGMMPADNANQNIVGCTNGSIPTSPTRARIFGEALAVSGAPSSVNTIGVLWNADDTTLTQQAQGVTDVLTAAPYNKNVIPLMYGRSVGKPSVIAVLNAAVGTINGLVVVLDADTSSRRKQITRFANKHQIPAIYGHKDFIDDTLGSPLGGLMSYGLDRYTLMFFAARDYAAPIFKNGGVVATSGMNAIGVKDSAGVPSGLPWYHPPPEAYKIHVNLTTAEDIKTGWGTALSTAFSSILGVSDGLGGTINIAVEYHTDSPDKGNENEEPDMSCPPPAAAK